LLKRLERAFRCLGQQPEAIVARADALCVQRDRSVVLCWGDRTIAGRCRGIAADGGICLETTAGRETFYSGKLRETP
jgi:biotin-(acetyl-CoA carboxylase) ligase